MIKQTAEKRAEELLTKYMDYHETRVRRIGCHPWNGYEREMIGNTILWICKKYFVVSRRPVRKKKMER